MDSHLQANRPRNRIAVGWGPLLLVLAGLAGSARGGVFQEDSASPVADAVASPHDHDATSSAGNVPAGAESADALYEQLLADAQAFEKQYNLVRRVVKLTRPSVVHIHARKSTRSANSAARTEIEEAGAGVVYRLDESDYILTNRHVIADAAENDIRIQLYDGRFFKPREIRSDREYDLAVLYIDESELTPARFGDSRLVDIGDFVIAFGSPFGLNHSVSYGVVSALGRRDLDLGTDGVKYQNFIQTDAAINPGNSGGPLINLRGEVIGINTAIASNSGGNDGIGFTIPADMVTHVANDLIRHGRVRRGFLGVSLDSRYSPEKAQALGLNTLFGARISGITANSPASEADLREGDVILTFDSITVINDSHLVSQVSLTDIGRRVPVDVYRGGQRKTVWVTVRERGGVEPAPGSDSPPENAGRK